ESSVSWSIAAGTGACATGADWPPVTGPGPADGAGVADVPGPRDGPFGASPPATRASTCATLADVPGAVVAASPSSEPPRPSIAVTLASSALSAEPTSA